jgi:hypothetical protein
MARGNQLVRQWQLLQLIDRPSGVTVEDAATELGRHVRTIWRDVGVLDRAGFPIYDDKSDGHRTIWKVTEAPNYVGSVEHRASCRSIPGNAALRRSTIGRRDQPV